MGTTTALGRVSVGTRTVTNDPGTSAPASVPAPSNCTVTLTVPDPASTTGLMRAITPLACTPPAA